ncbi:putative transcriptional regulator, GntR family [Nocardia nova SH22a]|uniref:Putative transcriptional regulator, GntR family n=1 Tax=Nocardia nova SH22a TaxID=1415166 RepID=W5TCF8_9NOCA|nr:GntR family transcriptional regulator [Nocardia nova]AHH16927.1 putative transcriptional regulator, GntR family [Nocardia nova SH22a]
MAVPSATGPGLGRAGRKLPLPQQIAHQIRNWIMSGTIKPDEFIRLDEVAEKLDVSVTPVREALLTLSGEGVVRVLPRRGFAVVRLSRADIADIFWVQAQLGNRLAQRAARQLGPAGADLLGQSVDRLESAVRAGDIDAIAECEFEFHRALNRAAGSPQLAAFQWKMGWYAPYRLYAEDRGWCEFAIDCHRRLVAALRDGDPERIAEESRHLYDDAGRRLIAHLERAGVWEFAEDVARTSEATV